MGKRIDMKSNRATTLTGLLGKMQLGMPLTMQNGWRSI